MIPVFDRLVDKLDIIITDHNVPSVVRAAAARGRQHILKYYARTDRNKVIRIAMGAYSVFFFFLANMIIVLHPAYKTRYFESQSWEREWIDNALDHVRETWALYRPEVAEVVAPVVGSVDNPFANLGTFGDQTADVLEEYLNAPAVSTCTNPLTYWAANLDPVAQDGTFDLTPMGALAQFALDYLSVPGV